MDGKPMVYGLTSIKKDDMAKAKVVPKGTVFFMKDGQMMMVETTGFSDKP